MLDELKFYNDGQQTCADGVPVGALVWASRRIAELEAERAEIRDRVDRWAHHGSPPHTELLGISRILGASDG